MRSLMVGLMSDQTKITDEASYIALKKHSPQLLARVEEFLDAGATAEQVEAALGKMYTHSTVMSPVVAAAIGAAYHMESERKK